MAMSLAPVALRKAQHVTQSRRVLREISANGIYWTFTSLWSNTKSRFSVTGMA
jgi:hypothetical protein